MHNLSGVVKPTRLFFVMSWLLFLIPVQTVSPQPSCVLQEFDLPTLAEGLVRKDLVIDAEGTIWFTELELNKIGQFIPALGMFREFDIPTRDSGPHSITIDPDGNIWFSETVTNQIGQFSPVDEGFTEFVIPTPDSLPYGITADALGHIWFTEMNAKQISRLDPTTGEFQEFPLTAQRSAATNIAIDPMTGDGWITELEANKIAHLNPLTSTITQFRVPSLGGFPHSAPYFVRVAPDGGVWFTEGNAQKIGLIQCP